MASYVFIGDLPSPEKRVNFVNQNYTYEHPRVIYNNANTCDNVQFSLQPQPKYILETNNFGIQDYLVDPNQIASKRDLFFKTGAGQNNSNNNYHQNHNQVNSSSPIVSSTVSPANQINNMPIINTGVSSIPANKSFDYYGSDREKPISSYLTSSTNSSSLSAASKIGSTRFTPSNYSSSNSNVTTTPNSNYKSDSNNISLPASSKISALINKVSSIGTHSSLNALSDDDEEDDEGDQMVQGDRPDNSRYVQSSNNSFAAEIANKKKQLFGGLVATNLSSKATNNNGRSDNYTGSGSSTSVLSAQVTPGNINNGTNHNNTTLASLTNKISTFGLLTSNSNSTPTSMANTPSMNGYNHHHHNPQGEQQLLQQQSNNPPQAIVDKCIGFANLPNQFYRRAVKRGFEFTLMLVGESGLGKSTLINTLFLSDIYSEEYPGPSNRIKKTVDVETSKQILVENGVQLALTIVDTPGFGDSVDNSGCWQKILNHIESKYEEYLKEESRINRKAFEDTRVHCCLYFIAPTGHGLKDLDIEFMKKLHDKVNIMPLIGKADTMTPEEIIKFKRRILNDIRQNGINIYEFPCIDDPEENRRNQELKDKVPYAVMGSNTFFDINNRRVRGRKYAWGVAEVDNPDHCDFSALRDMLLRRHMQNMKDVTSNVLYENYRCYKLSGGHPDAIADNENSPLTQLIEEKREYEDNLSKTEREMELVFNAKVKEKKDKIRESEAELEKRYEQMKRNLEEQFRELEDKRRHFEAEKHAWENGIPLVGHPQHLNGNGHTPYISHHNSSQGLNGMDPNRNDNSYPQANGSNGYHPNSASNANINVASSTSTLNSINSSKKGMTPPQYTDSAMKETYEEKKKEKKRFF